MSTNLDPRFNPFARLDYSEKGKIGLSSQLTLRRVVGILGMLLPLLLYVSLLIDTGYKQPLESVSHYYFTRVGSIFCIVISLLAIFLLIYKGEEPLDAYLSSAAGLFALCLVLFPTDNITDLCNDPQNEVAVTFLKTSKTRVILHYVASGIFLVCLASLSYFVFTKSDKPISRQTPAKRKRNRIYKITAFIMVGAILVIALGLFNIIPAEVYDKYRLTFWMECIAVESFGFSWLIKGDTFFTD
jgi:formate hydrogenlyase subunit 3/multisubunit Na+/H+ antiporter MnhD subunit